VSNGLPGADETHTGDGPAASTDLQWVRSSSPWGPAQCSSDALAAALTTTVVGDLAPVLLPSTTTLASSLTKLGPGQPTTFTAQVTTQYGALPQLPQGQVTFRDADTDEVLGTVTPNAAGVATLNHTFDPIAPGQPDQDRHVVAEYAGVAGDVATSASSTVTVTNTAEATVFNEIKFGAFRAKLGVETSDDVPVSVVATINKPAGPVPDRAKVQLYRDGVPLGEPVTLPVGNELVWNDVVARAPRTTTHRYHAEFAAFTDGYQRWAAASSPDVVVTVTGSDPSLDPPITGGGATGSLASRGGPSPGFGS